MKQGSTATATNGVKSRSITMDLRDAGRPKVTGAVTAVADPVPLVVRAVDRFVPVADRAEVLDMLGVA